MVIKCPCSSLRFFCTQRKPSKPAAAAQQPQPNQCKTATRVWGETQDYAWPIVGAVLRIWSEWVRKARSLGLACSIVRNWPVSGAMRLTVRQAAELAGWLAGCQWLPVAGWVAGWLGGWVGGWVRGWVAGWLAGWVGGWVAGYYSNVLLDITCSTPLCIY